uniref:Uncharacterized protein n=2 Tax=Schistocephalus solidus TaxID=70667 RepID=A0A0X3QFE7_SCHSO
MNRSSSFVILDESEDMASSGSEDLVESLLIDNSSKGPCQTAGALPTSTVTLTSKCDLESSSWAVLDESDTTLETSPPPETTFLMTATKNEEMEEDEADAEGGLTLSAAAELPPTSGEGGVDASVEQASESNVQLSSFSSLLERAFNFIQFLSDLLSNLDGTTKRTAVVVLVIGVLISVPCVHKFSNSSGLISDRLQSTEEDLEDCRKSLSKCDSQVHSQSKSEASFSFFFDTGNSLHPPLPNISLENETGTV